MRNGLLAAAAVLVMAAPALADVKAGVDAWARGEYRQAVEEWRGPAVAGDADAQFNLGQAYKLGRGVPVDPTLAISWFRKAALQGHQQAQDNYALALFQADRKDEALPWLEKSAARGEPRTQLVLGTMLFNGDGIARDYPRAYALLTRAAAAGLPSARTTLAQMDQYITPADRERGTALAQRYALDAGARPAPGPMQVTEVPASHLPEPIAKPESPPAKQVATKAGKTPPKPRGKPGEPPTKGGVEVAAAKPPVPPAKPAPAPAKPPRAQVAAAPKPPKAASSTGAPAAHAAAPVAGGGKWRVQLGAFRERGNAEALWSQVHAKLGGASPAYVAAGGMTRLQATGFANRAEAQRACRTARVSCVVVAP